MVEVDPCLSLTPADFLKPSDSPFILSILLNPAASSIKYNVPENMTLSSVLIGVSLLVG
jgi:hypothetical protein